MVVVPELSAAPALTAATVSMETTIQTASSTDKSFYMVILLLLYNIKILLILSYHNYWRITTEI